MMTLLQSLPISLQTVLLLVASNVFMTFAWCLRPRNGGSGSGSGKAHGCARCGYWRQKNTAAIISPVATMPQRSTGAGSRRATRAPP